MFASSRNKILETAENGLSEIEYISSGVQRISKLELEKSPDGETLIILNNKANGFFSNDGSSNYFASSPEITRLTQSFVDDWAEFRDAVSTYRLDDDRDNLFIVSESNYRKSIALINSVEDYVSGLDSISTRLELCQIVNVAVIALILLKILSNTVSELQRNKELSKEMFVDVSTGLYNRSKCQEVLKSMGAPDDSKERAVAIFDLNDLKKTNDSLGHRAGDQLIASFAEQLRLASNVFPFEIFIGRYGGDEFMISFNYVEEKDVKLYIKEVNELIKNFNDTSNMPFKLSCAVGYAITTAETKSLTTRELFDIADANMYTNKLAMKEKIREQLRKQGLEDNTQDDRI